jgi:ABC-type nitrate/sulfonate/bicarbonate transport system ATPase subunit
MNFQAIWADGQLRLTRGDGEFVAIAANSGGAYRLRLPNSEQADAAVNALESIARIAVLPSNGGVLGGLTVFENLDLPLHFGLQLAEREDQNWKNIAQLALRQCGLADEQIAVFGKTICADLSNTHRWMVGLVRNILRPPEILVLDRTFSGLSRQHVESRAAMQSAYHLFHPFRPALFVDVDSYELPRISHCKAEFEMGGELCPC